MTSIINYQMPSYRKIKKKLQLRYPFTRFFWPDSLFADREDWLRRFPLYLRAADCGLVIPDWLGMVGQGVVTEAQAFMNACKPVYCWANNRITSDFTFEVVCAGNWKRYARIVIIETCWPHPRNFSHGLGQRIYVKMK